MFLRPFALPGTLFRFAAGGLALGVGWKLGCWLGELATGEKTVDWSTITGPFWQGQTEDPLWKRKFEKVSEG